MSKIATIIAITLAIIAGGCGHDDDHHSLGSIEFEPVESSLRLRQRPTELTTHQLQVAYAYFNETLFNDSLPPSTIRYEELEDAVANATWIRRENGTREYVITFDPEWLHSRSLERSLSTLVHECVHVWQFHYPKEKIDRSISHDTGFRDKMVSFGLQPYNLDDEGKDTGDRVTHNIVAGGEFERVTHDLIRTGFDASWTYSSYSVSNSRKKVPHVEELLLSVPAGPVPGSGRDAQCACCTR